MPAGEPFSLVHLLGERGDGMVELVAELEMGVRSGWVGWERSREVVELRWGGEEVVVLG